MNFNVFFCVVLLGLDGNLEGGGDFGCFLDFSEFLCCSGNLFRSKGGIFVVIWIGIEFLAWTAQGF